MYIPSDFEEKDQDKIFDFLSQNNFGQVVSINKGRLVSTHLPFFVSNDRSSIFGHFARQNDQIFDLESQESLLTVQGPHEYISPTWYKNKGVPTWNYQSVHIYGRCELIHAESDLANIVNTLTVKHEFNKHPSWIPEYDLDMLNAIVGFRLAISKVECKFKLSQNRSLEDRKSVVYHLREKGCLELARAMQENSL